MSLFSGIDWIEYFKIIKIISIVGVSMFALIILGYLIVEDCLEIKNERKEK